ncbi:MAG: nucleotidyltransferase family protein [Pyrinomonadaceae bacterium]|nr:nucleotidyltransferase family protein [Pyrinomonadaceae bacterium]
MVFTGSFEPDSKHADDAFRWGVLQKLSQQATAAAVVSTFQRHGIDPIVIKGIAAARLYPDDQWRKFADIDLAVSAGDFERAKEVKLLATTGFQPIDLHKELRHLDTVPWADLLANSQTVNIEGTDIRFLREEDHLRIVCVHWLTDGGAHRHRLWDIYWSVKNRSAAFDWGRCLDSVSPVRRKWIIYTVGLAYKYLDLDIDGLPFSEEAKALPKWLIRSLEREWGSTTRLQPLNLFKRDPIGLCKQIMKRLPPNPIQATIDMEGSLDASTRIHYQIGDILRRSANSIGRLVKTAR